MLILRVCVCVTERREGERICIVINSVHLNVCKATIRAANLLVPCARKENEKIMQET